ncbi:hypothetical protein BC829DRAFT_469915 [Chytridium lagenaria]|nr:hypothetical protein BC829DRAFT_469915 [Chytridium lagenaria]
MFWLKGKNEEVEVYKISPTQEFENIHGGPPLVGYVNNEKNFNMKSRLGYDKKRVSPSSPLWEKWMWQVIVNGFIVFAINTFFWYPTLMTYIYHKCLPRISNATDNISARVQSAITEIYDLSLRRVSRTSVDLLSQVNRTAMASAGFKDAIEFLNFFGEEPKLAPLLLLVIPTLARDGETELGLGGQERTVKAVLRKFVQRIISKFMEMERTFFVFDDAQWLDAASLEVLEESIRVCPKHFELNGISQQELEALFIESVKMHRFNKIQAALVEEIYRLSGGNPLTSSMIIKSLSLDSSTLLVDEEGTLDIRGGKEAYDKLLSNSVGAAIMMQFDRFLKFACILGQYFTLTEVQELSSDSTVTVKDFQTLIKTSDRFDFLRVENGSGKEMGEAYSFRHISVCKTIYESISRNHMAHGLFPEGVGVASKLLESVLVEPLETVTLSPDMETKVDVDSAQLSLWFSMLAFCEARSSRILPGLRHASFALELIGEKLPTDLKEIQKETLKSILLQWKLFRKTKGGARRCVKPVITNFRIHREAISNALGALYFGSMFDKSYSKKRKGLILLKNLNFSIYNAVDFPEKWFEASLRSSMVLFALNGYLSDAYYRAALRAIPDPTLILDRSNELKRMYQENMDEIGRMVQGALFLKSTALFFRGVLNEPKELDFSAIHGIMRMEFIWSTSGGIALTRSYVFLDDLDALTQALELLDLVCINAEKQLPNPENVTPNVMIRVFYIARRAIAESELELQKLKYSDIEDVLAKTHKSTQPEVLTWLKEISIRCSSVEFAFGGSGFAVLLTSIPVWILTTEFLVPPGSTCVAKKPRRMKKGRVDDVGHGTVTIFEEVFDRATLLAETAKEILFLSTKCLELSLGGKLIVMWLGHVISHALHMILRDDGVSLAFFKILRGALKRLSRLNDTRAGMLGSDYQLFWAFIKALLGLYTLNTKEADGLLDDATRQFEGFSAMLLVKWLKRARLKKTTVKF